MKITENIFLELFLKDGRVIRSLVKRGTCPELNVEMVVPKIEVYLAGLSDPDFGLEELDLSGYSDRVVRVYKALREFVEPGSVITYGALGSIVGEHPRFIGLCMRINRFPLLIPCHRVVSGKGLGGYSYGAEVKRILLLFERRVFLGEGSCQLLEL